MHAYRNTLPRDAAGAWCYSGAIGPVILPIIIGLVALEVIA
jgi:hypothetical protein